MGFYKRVFALAAFVFLSACNTLQVGTDYRTAWQNRSNLPAERDLFVTIDGTSNTPVSRTNAGRLYEIVDAHSAQHPGKISTYYAEGVGGNGKFNLPGLIGGFGMSDDIRNAYEFLTTHYNTEHRSTDRIFLSGFSRGAYAVRALGGMIFVAGIPDLSDKSPKERKQIVRAIFKAYKTSRRKNETRLDHSKRRRTRIEKAIDKFDMKPAHLRRGAKIEAMALWDTVESLGTPNRSGDPREERDRYLLTNCNVKTVFHALALDDNRPSLFTPIYVDAIQNNADCSGDDEGQARILDKPARIEEVWFAGAHSDVGGTYPHNDVISNHLAGVSLNWMLRSLRPYNLAPEGFQVYEDPFGAIHNAREALIAYKRLEKYFREPIDYQILAQHLLEGTTPDRDDRDGMWPEKRPKIHASALARLRIVRELNKFHSQCPSPHQRTVTKDEVDPDLPKLLCAHDLETTGFVAELRERECLETSWEHGILLKKGVADQEYLCVEEVGTRPKQWPDVPGIPPIEP